MARDDAALLSLIAIVAVVGFIGLVTTARVDSPTGNVVYVPDEPIDCSACSGEPVCAADGTTVATVENACEATCAGLRVVYEEPCDRIPKN